METSVFRDHPPGYSAAPSLTNEGATSKKAQPRKRTKTGCLTCRKRRIKCDETKPTCNNCVKSKRHCDGYNQRLTFKAPLGADPFNHHASAFGNHAVFHPALSGPSQPPVIQPSHLQRYHHRPAGLAHVGQPPFHALNPTSFSVTYPSIAPKPPGPIGFGLSYSNAPQNLGVFPPASHLPDSIRFLHDPVSGAPSYQSPVSGPISPTAPVPWAIPDELFGTLSQPHLAESLVDDVYLSPVSVEPQEQILNPALAIHSARHDPPEPSRQEPQYWGSDDEASMGDSEDEYPAEDAYRACVGASSLGAQVARCLDDRLSPFSDTRVRTFSGGLVQQESVLDTYTPSSASSPLNDSQTAAIFWYFVNVTGPSISLHERHPFDPTAAFRGEAVPKERQHIWNYTFPVASLGHPALLQAILALGGLHLAKMEDRPPTAAMKHYHLSIRRIARNYSSPTRRTQPATLAATLLLGFYEVWNSDHEKWCKHMWGARAIIKEIPLRAMARRVILVKKRKRQELGGMKFEPAMCGYEAFPFFAQGRLGPDETDIDVDLIRRLTGTSVSFDEPGSGHEGDMPHRKPILSDKDIENYEDLSDLYWWFCKMDVYQSVLGGTRLFMEYHTWTQIPPRAPFGRIDAIYGTFDHLLLLLGRLANYSSLDLSRKRRARKAEAAQNKAQASQSPPMFPGLFPSKGSFTIPSGFSPPLDTGSPSDKEEAEDLDSSTASALQEWDAIRQAFSVFQASIGVDFEPMGPDLTPPIYTPFGPALQYRTLEIALIWMNYYLGLIMLHRAHPSMPPVAMLAAGLAARQTSGWANQMGRIAGGLHDDCEGVMQVSTVTGSAFIESSFCLFVSGVQYQDPTQRAWLIKRLHEIARLTGWESARQIAKGCESAWVRAAQLGRGPLYERTVESSSAPSAVRRLDRRIRELEEEQGGDETENRFVLARTEQTHYAMGLLSVEGDLERLDLAEKD